MNINDRYIANMGGHFLNFPLGINKVIKLLSIYLINANTTRVTYVCVRARMSSCVCVCE